MSFYRETIGGNAKCLLFSQAQHSLTPKQFLQVKTPLHYTSYTPPPSPSIKFAPPSFEHGLVLLATFNEGRRGKGEWKAWTYFATSLWQLFVAVKSAWELACTQG